MKQDVSTLAVEVPLDIADKTGFACRVYLSRSVYEKYIAPYESNKEEAKNRMYRILKACREETDVWMGDRKVRELAAVIHFEPCPTCGGR